MRAIVQREFGASEVLRIEEVPLPVPAEGEVRVRVAAAGVHAVDLDIRRDAVPPSMPRPTLPMTPGREIAGVIDAVGAGVDAGLGGERVVAHVGFRSGGYAEFALAAASALHPIPEGVTFSEAVATIGTGGRPSSSGTPRRFAPPTSSSSPEHRAVSAVNSSNSRCPKAPRSSRSTEARPSATWSSASVSGGSARGAGSCRSMRTTARGRSG